MKRFISLALSLTAISCALLQPVYSTPAPIDTAIAQVPAKAVEKDYETLKAKYEQMLRELPGQLRALTEQDPDAMIEAANIMKSQELPPEIRKIVDDAVKYAQELKRKNKGN